ncbi:MAG: type II secretion system F family protein [Thermoguttaceae bacterium]|jgi:type II secretory pathway component PulF
MSSADSPDVASSMRLSAAEAAELAAGVAELAKAGLPLPAGLRAMAEEWPTRRLRRVLLDLADRVEQGVSLEDALGAIGGRLPVHLRGLITAGIRSGHLAEALEQFVDLERTQHELRRLVWLNLAYPAFLMVVMSFLAILACFYIVPQFGHTLRDFKTDLPQITKLVLEGAKPFAYTLITITALFLAIPLILSTRIINSWISPAFYILPFIGPLLRLSQMARFSRLMAMLLQQRIPLPESLRLTAKGVQDAYLARACRRVAAEIEQGRSLSESMGARRQFSCDMLPMIEVGEKASTLGGAFQSAAEMFEGRANAQGRSLEVFLLPATFLVIICFCGVIVLGLFMPLISLITRLTGGGPQQYYYGQQQSQAMTPTQAILGSIVLIVLGIVFLVIVRKLARPRKLIGETFDSIITVICWIFIVLGLIGLAFSPVLLTSWVVLMATVFVVVEILRRYYKSKQNTLLWSLAISAEKGIPLVPTLEAFARGSGGRLAEKAHRLAQLLNSGVSLPDAIDLVPGILPQKVLPMIRVGYDSGALAKSLRQAVSTRDLFTIIGNSFFAKLVYIGMVIIFGTGVLTFMLIKIVPNYEKIFRDFRTDLPVMTTALIGTSNFIVQFGFIFMLLFLLFIGLIIYLMVYYMGWINFSPPGLARIMRRRHAAIILDSLALAAESNQPLGNGVLTLAGTYPQSSIRRKLSYVGAEIRMGRDWSESLCSHGLIKRADQAVLKAAQRVGNLPWAMREMADSNRRRLAYRLNALVQVAYPPVIICIGLMVMFIVVGLFYPLVSLIMRLTGG